MSARVDFERELVAEIHASLGDFASTGTYTAPAGSPVACRCIVDKGMQSAGEYAPTFGPRVVLHLWREDVAAPVIDATVAVDGESFVLDAPVPEGSDDAISVWVVRHA